ncbi:hypothetical protein P8452_66358 [Trifolium repens]|nr:hypothetical protein P8452_66358 [Trifolium repens]
MRFSIGSFLNKKIPFADIIPPTLVKGSFNSIKYLKLRDVKLNERGELLYIVSVLKSASRLVELVIESYSHVDITQAPWMQAMPEVDMLWAVARSAEGAAKENKRGRE